MGEKLISSIWELNAYYFGIKNTINHIFLRYLLNHDYKLVKKTIIYK